MRPATSILSKPDQTYTVPRDGYFAMGDNSYNSFDSRYWGTSPGGELGRPRVICLLAVFPALGTYSLGR